MVGTRTLSTPVQTDDGPVDQVVTDIAWTAAAGASPRPVPGLRHLRRPAPGPGRPDHLQVAPDVLVRRGGPLDPGGHPGLPRSGHAGTDPDPDQPDAGLGRDHHIGLVGYDGALAVAALAVAVLALLGVVLLLIRGRRRGDSGRRAERPAARRSAGCRAVDPGPDGRVTTGEGAPDPAPRGSERDRHPADDLCVPRTHPTRSCNEAVLVNEAARPHFDVAVSDRADRPGLARPSMFSVPAGRRHGAGGGRCSEQCTRHYLLEMLAPEDEEAVGALSTDGPQTARRMHSLVEIERGLDDSDVLVRNTSSNLFVNLVSLSWMRNLTD